MLSSSLIYKDGQFFDADGRPFGYIADGLRGFATLSGSGQVIAGVANYRIRVFGYVLSCLAATAVKFQTSTGPTDISLTHSLAATSGFVVTETPTGWFQTGVGDALNLNMTVATTVGVGVIYALVR